MVAVLAGLLCACAELRPLARQVDDDPEVAPRFLQAGQRVRARGRVRGRTFVAQELKVRSHGETITVTGELEVIGADHVRVGGLIIARPHDLAPPPLGATVRVTCEQQGRGLRAGRIERRRPRGRAPSISGPIARVDHEARTFVVGGVVVSFADVARVEWDAGAGALPGPALAPKPVRQRVVRVAGDERRLDDRRRIGDVTLGGEIEYFLDFRRNRDLDDGRRRDRLTHGIEAELEFEWTPNSEVLGFLAVDVEREFVHFDQDADIEFGNGEVAVDELYIRLDDLPWPGIGFQIGRQEFVHGREWLIDTELDALRLRARVGKWPVDLELAIAAVLFDPDADEDDVVNVFAAASIDAADTEWFVYALHRNGGEDDLSRSLFGVSAEHEAGDYTLWIDAAVGAGDASGVGVDLAGMYEFESAWPWPYVFGGVAFGSDGFRQSGLHDNATKFGGVARYRYLGEFVRPELANLFVFTAGVGVRPWYQVSIDLVYHRYAQVERSDLFRSGGVRQDPTGLSRALGDEIDLVIGIRSHPRFDIEIDVAYFFPGPAFATRDAGLRVSFSVAWLF